MKKQFLEVGKIVGTHGVKGAMRVTPWADNGNFLVQFTRFFLDEGKKELQVISAKHHGSVVLLAAKGITSMEKAERLRGKTLFISRNDIVLEEGRYFVAELLGCKVFNADSGNMLGTVSDVSKTGANDVWHITREGKEYLVPSIPEVVVKVDIEAETVIIRPIKGIFDDEN